ncbi:trigger factor [Candidatus Ichthyocystis hellenicum]|uniref:trigger factor n=1 Tax=Candidatus Ichthyocystis hellenicum TaxID=1561003 RepID=UPI000B87DF14|nr:trigger factor [Candidatus Ichthyocystis hellenicum]
MRVRVPPFAPQVVEEFCGEVNLDYFLFAEGCFVSQMLQGSDSTEDDKVSGGMSSPLHRSFDLFLEESVIFPVVQGELERIAKTSKWPGFRPGKVPLKMVAKKHQNSVLREAMRSFFNHKLHQKLDSESWLMCQLISANLSLHTPGSGWLFSVEIEIFPELVFQDWNEVVGTVYTCEVQPGDVDTAVMRLRKGMADLVDKDGPATNDDCIFINGKVCFKEPGSDTEVDKPVSVAISLKEADQYLQSMLVGAERDDALVFNWTPPAAWNGVPAGVPARIDVRVEAVKHVDLPEVDRFFFESLGLPMGHGESEMREEISDLLSFHAEKMLSQWTELSFFCGLMERVSIQIPESIKQSVCKNYLSHLQQNHFAARRLGAVSRMMEQRTDFLDPVFVKYLSFREVMTVLFVKNGEFKVSEEELNAAVKQEMEFNVSKHLFNDKKKIGSLTEFVRMSILMKKIIAWLSERCHISKHVLDFEELLRIESSAEPNLDWRNRIEVATL